MKKLLLFLMLFMVSPRICINIEASNAIVSICNVIKKGMRFLFIGDSITDGGWGRSGGSMMPTEQRNQKDLNHIYGHSYMMLCAARIQSDFPEQGLQFFNRGISGNTLQDLQGRWQADCLDLNPDVVTLLIGTNDVDQYLSGKAHLDMKKWENDYRQLLDQLRTANPDVKIILGTPFVAQVGRIGLKDNYQQRKALIAECAAVVRRIASDYNATLLDFEKMFYGLTEQNAFYWIWDGIHPTAAGHQKMADLWLSKIK
jgi:lysophospholipase L1-like esterase